MQQSAIVLSRVFTITERSTSHGCPWDDFTGILQTEDGRRHTFTGRDLYRNFTHADNTRSGMTVYYDERGGVSWCRFD